MDLRKVLGLRLGLLLFLLDLSSPLQRWSLVLLLLWFFVPWAPCLVGWDELDCCTLMLALWWGCRRWLAPSALRSVGFRAIFAHARSKTSGTLMRTVVHASWLRFSVAALPLVVFDTNLNSLPVQTVGPGARIEGGFVLPSVLLLGFLLLASCSMGSLLNLPLTPMRRRWVPWPLTYSWPATRCLVWPLLSSRSRGPWWPPRRLLTNAAVV